MCRVHEKLIENSVTSWHLSSEPFCCKCVCMDNRHAQLRMHSSKFFNQIISSSKIQPRFVYLHSVLEQKPKMFRVLRNIKIGYDFWNAYNDTWYVLDIDPVLSPEKELIFFSFKIYKFFSFNVILEMKHDAREKEKDRRRKKRRPRTMWKKHIINKWNEACSQRIEVSGEEVSETNRFHMQMFPEEKKNCTADTNSDSTKVLFHRCWLYVWVSAYLGCSGTYDRFHNDYSLSWRLMAIAVRVNACVSWPMHIFDFYRCDYFPFVCYASSFNSLRLFFCSILTTTDVKVLLTHKCHHFISRPS